MFMHAWLLKLFLPNSESVAVDGGSYGQSKIQIAYASLPTQPSDVKTHTAETEVLPANKSPVTEQQEAKPKAKIVEKQQQLSDKKEVTKPLLALPMKSNFYSQTKTAQSSTKKTVKREAVHETAKNNSSERPHENHTLSETPIRTTKGSGAETSDRVSSGFVPTGPTISSYQAELRAWLERHKRYPKKALRKRIQGEGILYFKIDRKGKLLAHEIRNSTGSRILDREILAMLKRASPLPTVPGSLSGTEFEFSLPVNFIVQSF
jgi:protein TonB